MEQPLKLTREQIIEQEMGPVYDFFVQAERLGEHFSYKKICEVYPHDIKTIRKYAQNYWSWFLLQEGKSRPFTFSCCGLVDYPKQYFLDAHKPHQGRYFYHFAVAMQDAAARHAERQRAREEAKARAQQLELPAMIGEEQLLAPHATTETLVPEQELPEQVHIETIEDEMEENGESNGNGSLVALASMSPAVEELPSGEGDPESVNHDDEASERMEDGSSPAPLSGEELQPAHMPVVASPRERPRQGQKGCTTNTLVTVAVCLVVVIGLTVWWVASRR